MRFQLTKLGRTKMERNTQGLVVIFSVLALLVGFTLGAVLIPQEVKEIQMPGETIYTNVTVDKIVEVEIPEPSILDEAVEVFMEAVEDEEDEAGNDVDILGSYNFDEVEISRIYDVYSVEYDDEDAVVEFSIRLKFDDGDDRIKTIYDVTVEFEEGEDTIVTAVEA